MSFLGWAALIGWTIVLIQNGFVITRWILNKVREAKALKEQQQQP